MRHIKLFEKFKGRKKVLRDIDRGKEGISEISNKIDPKHREINSPLRKLKLVMEKIRNRMGLTEEIKYINSGSWGMAFKIGDKVIKLTSNREEVSVAKKLVGKEIPNVVNYYQILYIEEYGIWAILMDLVNMLSKKEKFLIDIFQFCLDLEEVMDEIRPTRITKSEALSMWIEYQDLVESLEKSGIPTADMHPDNIGRFHGKLVHFDIMPESGQLEISKLSNVKN